MTDEKKLPDYHKFLKQHFSERLINRMLELGYTSNRGENGVNGKQLADAAGVSFPMARRYITGNALPENKTLKKIGEWLNIDPWFLLYGYNSPTGQSKPDYQLLKEIMLEMLPLIESHLDDNEQLAAIIDNILEMYQSIVELDLPDEKKQKSIRLMGSLLKKQTLCES